MIVYLHGWERGAHHVVGEGGVVGVHGGAGHGGHAGMHRVAEIITVTTIARL